MNRNIRKLELRFDSCALFRSGLDLKHLNNNLRIYEHKLWKLLLSFNPIITPFEIQQGCTYGWMGNREFTVKITEVYFETDHQKQTFIDFFEFEETGDGGYVLNKDGEQYYIQIYTFETNEPTWSINDITTIKCKNNLLLRVYSPIKTYNKAIEWRKNWFYLRNKNG